MTNDPLCVCGCGRPVIDGYATEACARKLAQSLSAASGHAEDAEAVLTRQARYGAGGSGGSGDRLPGNLTAADQYGVIVATFRRWTNTVAQDTGRQPRWRRAQGPPCPTGQRCDHDSCATIRRRIPGPALSLQAAWLSQHTETLRKHPDAGRAFKELHEACADLSRLVDRPADKRLVGMCDCGKILYVSGERAEVTCPQPTCKLTWNVERSRDILREALRGKLLTAAEAAHLAAHWDERTSEQIRKLINKWASRSTLIPHGEVEGSPAFLFGEVIDQLAKATRREPAAA